MLQTIWFFLKITIIIVGTVWLLSLPGSLSLSIAQYDLNIKTGLFLIGLITSLFIAIAIIQLLTSIISLPLFFKRRKEKKNWQKSYQSITQSLSAAAFGDGKNMAKMARKAHSLLPVKNSLPLFLEAQAAYMMEDKEGARKRFDLLLQDQETLPLGLQGLLKGAVEEKEYKKALHFSEKAYNLYPKKPWVLQTYYQLLIKNAEYEKAVEIGSKAVKQKAITQNEYKSDEAVIYFIISQTKEPITYLKKALSADPALVSASVKLAKKYLSDNKQAKAAKVIKDAWKVDPHPELSKLWMDMAPSLDKPRKYIKWFEGLASLNSNHVETYLLLAKAHLHNDDKDNALDHVESAWSQYPSARCLALYQDIDIGFPSQASIPDKVWICRETGLIYDEWRPIAEPHNGFNTMIWEIPSTANIMKSQNELEKRKTSFFLNAV